MEDLEGKAEKRDAAQKGRGSNGEKRMGTSWLGSGTKRCGARDGHELEVSQRRPV